MTHTDPPEWASSVLCCPQTGERQFLEAGRLLRADGSVAGRSDAGIVRFPIPRPDDSIKFYRRVGGPHFHERANIPFAMSSLDTAVYHSYLDRVRPHSPAALIVDVGGGDGRNARFWLDAGFERVVVVDAAADALLRFRTRVAETPHLLGRLLLIEADVRTIPLLSGCAECVVAIETLYYLNEDYEIGLDQCRKLLTPSGKILLSERDYEGGLVLSLLYRGVSAMLESGGTRSLWDGASDALVRSRCFSEAELVSLVQRHGLQVIAVHGTSLLALLLGWLRGKGCIDDQHANELRRTRELLDTLGREGRLRRCHVVIAERHD
jgi:SAM-dependent methyltransferase